MGRGSRGHDLARITSMVTLRAGLYLVGLALCGVYVAWHGGGAPDDHSATAAPASTSYLRRNLLGDGASGGEKDSLAPRNERWLKKVYDGTDGKTYDDDIWQTGNNTGRFPTCKSLDQDEICRGFGAEQCKKMAPDEMYVPPAFGVE